MIEADPFIKGMGPCVVHLHGPSMENTYGPFESGQQAMTWMNEQIENGHVRSFSVEPLRTPYRVRDYDDWWAGAWHQVTIADQEFPKEPWFKLKGWRRWRRNSNKILV